MATFTKNKLSGSTSGRGVAVAATATPGTLLHTAVTGTTDFDEIWLYAMNVDTVTRKLTIEFGGTSTSDLIELEIPAESGLICVLAGIPLNNALVVRAFAATTNVINIFGFIHEIRA